MAVRIGPRLEAFLAEPLVIVVGTKRADGSVQMNPVWFEFADGSMWINGTADRGWLKHLRRDPGVTLLLLDPRSPFRWAQIQGRVREISSDGAAEHIEHLSRRYTGGPYPDRTDNRVKVEIEPLRVTGAENMQPWDASRDG